MALIKKIKVGGTTYDVGFNVMTVDEQLAWQGVPVGYSGPALMFSGDKNAWGIWHYIRSK